MIGAWVLGLLAVSYGVGRWTIPAGLRFLEQHGVMSDNFRDERIPTSFGGLLVLLLLWIYVPMLGLVHLVPLLFPYPLLFAVLFSSVSVAFFGWLDDTVGNHEQKGFRGHVGSLIREGTLSTGTIKAVGGGATAAIAAVATGSGPAEWLLHAVLIALMTNGLNLLDLRPGRSLKVYLASGILLLLFTASQIHSLLFVPLLGLALALFRHDLSGRVMLGDSGSNLLGNQLALWSVTTLSLWGVGILILFFIGLHVYGETRSITRLIERTPWLAYLDRLGRR